LSDGEYFSVIGLVPEKADSNVLKSKIVVLRLGKDGRRFLPSVIVSDWLSSGGMLFDNASGPMPTIAADTMSDRFKDRLYVTWPDMKKDSASIFVAYSSDKGESWSKPVLVSSPEVMGSESDGFHSCPTVAVNRAGILGLIWHRGVHHADLGRSPLQDNISHQTWFTASLDGGETFLPAVKLSKNDLPKRFRIGEALGLDVDSKGNFHAAWVENRTGNPQIYYAPITVTVSQSQLNPVIGSPDTTNKEGIDKIYKDEILPLIVRKEVIDWDSLEKQLTTKHGRSIGLEVVSLARPPYHYTRFEWEKFQSSLSTHIRRYGTASFSSVTFNNFAYAIFLHFGDKKILEEAANWSLKTIQELEDPEYLDTYASILYRMGKTRVAIEWQEKALTKAGDEGTRKRFQTAIDKMKRGEPTWPVPEQPKK
ncbi:MAG TPA: sialidase family protein, partial [Pyrinomonadaceae bacterium]|nr:sialidase family protein [Pyrinomonadaceae bacterium]